MLNKNKHINLEVEMKNTANAMLRLDGKLIPVLYDEGTEKLTVYFGAEGVTVPDDLDKIVVQKLGVLTGGLLLFKLCIPLSNVCSLVTNEGVSYVATGNQIESVEYYIEDYQPNSIYSEMRLRFAELDYFVPSLGRASAAEKEIVFSRKQECICSFDINFRGVTITASFDTKAHGNFNCQVTAETFSELTLKFPETKDIDFLNALYHRTRNFFSFICNRQNIALRDAVLIGIYTRKDRDDSGAIVDRDFYTKQRIYFSQKYLEPVEGSKQISKTLNIRYFASNLQTLFQLFFEEKAEEDALINASSIHSSFKYRNLIDLEQSLHITATFEYYVRTILPEISSQSTIDFIEDVRAFLTQYITETTGKKREKAKDYLKRLEPQVSLAEKIKKAYDGYTGWSSLSEILSERFGRDIAQLAQAANSWRNELAHEKRTYCPDEDTIYAVRLVEHLNYCIVLRKAGYNDQEIKNIVDEILTK